MMQFFQILCFGEKMEISRFFCVLLPKKSWNLNYEEIYEKNNAGPE